MLRGVTNSRGKAVHNPNGLVIYDGPSMLTGDPIVVIATGFTRASNNGKTGEMLQTWILPRDIAPHEAVKTGQDAPVCGSCPFASGNGCYVQIQNAPLSVWRAYHVDRYAKVEPENLPHVFGGHKLRLGSYGDPAAVPFGIWESALTYVTRHTGYTHQWRTCDQRFAGILMASVERIQDVTRAEAKGWRTFYVSADGQPLPELLTLTEPMSGRKIVTCPASAEGGHRTSCEDCGLCDGTYFADKRTHIMIRPHGAKAKRTARAVS